MNTATHSMNTSPTKISRIPAYAGHLFQANLRWRLALSFFLFCAVLLAQPCAATPLQWDFTGSLNEGRSSHAATLLQNGMVLVEGGEGSGDRLPSAELYDPATAIWSTTGSLTDKRSFHTATLLQNGIVLVEGGFTLPGGALASAELYDSATGTWSITGSLNTGRYTDTATLLPSSKVLVAAGVNFGGQALASAELYDPATGMWTLTGSLYVPRAGHTATLLPNGKVLVVGGYNTSTETELASAELYNPATGRWSSTGSLNTARYDHTATLLQNGLVLVAAGSVGGYTSSAELYNPATGTWSTTGSLATARTFHTATLLLTGKVLVAGGSGSSGILASAELYDPEAPPTNVQGQGAFDSEGNQVTFRFLATQADDSSDLGQFSVCDSAAGVCLTNGRIQSLSITGNTAEFRGSGRVQDAGRVTFNVSVTDNGEPGTSDTISITLSNGYSASGTLTSGDIRIY